MSCTARKSGFALRCFLEIDRGAEQGDPLGSVYCALVIADVLEIVRDRLREKGIQVFDVWYMDDGQIFCDPEHVGEVLRTLDELSLEVGAVRGRGDNAKSVVRILGTDAAISAASTEWCAEYVIESTKPIPTTGGHVLRVDFESTPDISLQVRAITDEVASLHANLAQVEDVATEVVLVRACADVSKIVHVLRAVGADVPLDDLDRYDNLLKSVLQRLLGGLLDDTSLLQASLGV